MENEEIKFTQLANFQDKQKTAWFTLLKPECKYLLYGGAASGGKSYFLRWASIGLGMYYFAKYGIENVPIGLFSADYPTLKDRQVIKIKNEIPDFLGQIKESRDEGYAFMGSPKYGSFLVLLRNLDDPSKYKSAEFAAILVEELTENKESTFDDLRFRLRYGKINDVKFVGATNPGGVGHGFVKRKWVTPDAKSPDHEQDRFFFVPARYADNSYTTEEYVKQLSSLPDAKRRAYMEGDWDIFSGQVFEEWRRERHTLADPEYPVELCEKKIGFDWGYNNPGCAIWEAFTPDGRAYAYRELYQNKTEPQEWANQIKIFLQVEKVSEVVLPHDCFSMLGGNETVASIFENTWKDLGAFRPFIVRGNTMGTIAVQNRVTITHNYLRDAPDGKPYFQVLNRCENLIRTIPELVYSKDRLEMIDKAGEDHAFDAASIALMRHWEVMVASGAVKESGPTKPSKTFELNERGEIQSPDFWAAMKDQNLKLGKTWENN